MTNIEEKWVPVKGYEGLYKVSSLGKIVAEERLVELFGGNATINKLEKQLKTKKHYSGYRLVCLCKGGKRKYTTVHRVVAENLLPNPLKKSQVNHKDGDKSNNAVCNLEWVTSSENLKHAFAAGLKKPRKEKMGDKNKAKPVYVFENGSMVKMFDNISSSARHFNKPFRLFSKYFIKYGSFAIQGYVLSTKNEYEKDCINYFDADRSAMQRSGYRV